MPAKSEAQRRALYAKFGEDWVREHHYDNPGKLPERVGGAKRRAKRGKKRSKKTKKRTSRSTY